MLNLMAWLDGGSRERERETGRDRWAQLGLTLGGHNQRDHGGMWADATEKRVHPRPAWPARRGAINGKETVSSATCAR